MYRDTTWAVATAAERSREGDEMKAGEGERHRKRPEGRATSRSVFLPDEQITHTTTALILSAPVTDTASML